MKEKFIDKSRYAKKHKEISDYIKHQTNIDIDEYRDGDGSSSSTTSYWEQKGAKVAVNWNKMPRNVKNTILGMKGIKVETGGAWLSYISRSTPPEQKVTSRPKKKTSVTAPRQPKKKASKQKTKRNGIKPTK